jgi:hypothetical protein
LYASHLIGNKCILLLTAQAKNTDMTIDMEVSSHIASTTQDAATPQLLDSKACNNTDGYTYGKLPITCAYAYYNQGARALDDNSRHTTSMLSLHSAIGFM